ncbi:chemotaxis protein MotA [Azospirillaceae bacterium]
MKSGSNSTDANTGAFSTGRFRPRPSFDLATIGGLAAAFGVIGAAILFGGPLAAFYDTPAFLIVFGGTTAVTMISFSIKDVGAAWSAVSHAIIRSTQTPQSVGRQMLVLADAVRRTGMETLRKVSPELRGEPFLHRSLSLVVEGLSADEIDRLLTVEIDHAAAAQAAAAGLLRRAAEVAPAMGLIGTLVGLVQMLGKLDNPAAIGPGMAVALLTTLYGAVLGNMLLAPLAGKIERTSEEDALIRDLYRIGAVSIARQENPRRLEMLFNTLLPPGSRIAYFDR